MRAAAAMDHDLIVIGGGAAGLGALRAALRAGADVALITDSPPGGDCTFTGCVPSKTLLAALNDGLGFGAAAARARSTVARVAASESVEVLRAAGATVIEGRARLVTHDTVAVGERRVSSPRTVIATGSRPAVPAVPGLEQSRPLSSEDVFDLTEAPDRLCIVGGGATGCEMAHAFASAGTKVALLESQSRILPDADPEASAVIRGALESLSVEVLTSTRVAGVSAAAGAAPATSGEAAPEGAVSVLTRSSDQTAQGDRDDPGGAVACDKLLVAVGRAPRSEGLGLEELGVKVDDQGGVITDDRMMTSLRGVYAAGDVTGRAMLSHAADEMGRIAAGNALGRPVAGRFHAAVTPRVVFTVPEVASVGVHRSAAPAGSRAAYLPLTEVDRALMEQRTDGFISIVAGPRRWLRNTGGGRILGATIVAPRAGEMIAEVVLAMRADVFAGRLAQASHAYPTWSSGVQQAAAQFFGEIDGRQAGVIGA
ncbi:MAG: FAD-dependent oxidoreductase [Acidimicrobiaceae bacterium]|nr:FAD-dependent oxidoreductase [Acidimicrobiaceae bacterium]MCY4176417.1 FAD-dependent oxidoreductase [Acidimicrobiaceae bacterium]